jgi:hypothetical protein
MGPLSLKKLEDASAAIIAASSRESGSSVGTSETPEDRFSLMFE